MTHLASKGRDAKGHIGKVTQSVEKVTPDTQRVDAAQSLKAGETKKIGKWTDEANAARRDARRTWTARAGKDGVDVRGENGVRKKKRKKVRSRQKNLRKDTRSAEQKPVHLTEETLRGGRVRAVRVENEGAQHTAAADGADGDERMVER